MNSIIIIAIILLVVIAIGQIIRIFEIAKNLQKEIYSDVPTHSDNDTQGKLLLAFMILFVGYVIYTLIYWNEYTLAGAFSKHGKQIDFLMQITMWIILAVFFITQPILFYFSYKYRAVSAKTKAVYVSHSNKLETIWTIIPAVILTILISYGLYTWAEITGPPKKNAEDPMVVEVYAQQFKWTARYSGKDNVLGKANVRLISNDNILGVDTNDFYSKDDFIVDEIHLPVNKSVVFLFRSQDVIHSAYMPHFRAQMNCVPGMITQFAFTPDATTLDAREDAKIVRQVADINAIRQQKGEDLYEFDYLILCNKICGAAHYNMQIKIIVESQEDFETWIKSKNTIVNTSNSIK